MCSIQFECCPSTTLTLGPIKNSLIILSLYLSTVFQSFRAGEKWLLCHTDCRFISLHAISLSFIWRSFQLIKTKPDWGL